ncbi:glycosyl hydrolase, family 16 [Arcticibacter svalbardensis MN12-7]|uniref:Glycosyl hydrolase, family 16 n=1 Tax=Arcticibacter svalbardensis MN12-7 TaxID=1150600 RepID=R9GUP0_9SPHI|nr:hypothetical protein [Arcticibacter svalbardensis]EOR95446.1 glycosyl hydrolase, family 16 [Arcticibacter svalbardensis MN12-7]
MNATKYIVGLAFLLVTVAGCKKEIYDDTSFLNGIADPVKLSVLFDITQDNTGLVTISPNGEGVASYDVYYGDGGDTYAKVLSGNTAQHKYVEGLYTVKIIGYNITGKSMEITQPLTISFKAPEDLKTTITTTGLSVDINATALYETMFHVYYGDATDQLPEPYDTFLEGTAAMHTYASAGTYTIRVVALSGGAATTTYSETVKVGKQIDLPVSFNDPQYDYTMGDFGGNISSLSADPVNSAKKVMKSVKPNGAEVWAGTTIGTAVGFTTRIPISADASRMTMRVYSPAAGIHVRLKIEDHSDGTKSVETEALTTLANTWETLTFDFKNAAVGTPALNLSTAYDKASVFFDFNTSGDGKIFYWDDVKFVTGTVTAPVLGIPLDFESSILNYSFTNFDGGVATVISNPNPVGINTSSTVAKMVKGAGQVWGGAYISLDHPIDFSTKKFFKLKVFSPRVGAKVLLKVENLSDGTISFDKEVVTTVANAWEELTFDYSTINTANSYQKVVLIFDNGTVGDGSANFTWLFDDLSLN